MFTIIINQILKMLLLLLLGVACYHLKFIDQKGNKMLANILLMIVNPALIFMSLQKDYTPELVSGLLIAYVLAFATHVIAILFARLVIKKENPEHAVEQFAIIYSNCGFIGVPLINSVFGSDGVLFLTAYMTVFNIFAWTHGFTLMSGNHSLKEFKKGFFSPTVIACLSGLILFIFQIRLPVLLADTLTYISDMNTPLAMIIAGVSVAQTNPGHMLRNKKIYFITFCKLVLIPAIILVLLIPFQVNRTVAYTILIAAACPAATTGTAFALRFQKNYKYASELYTFTTLCSLITIPLFVYAAERLLV